jgi:hypothetical protein
MMSESTAATNAAETLDGAATDGAPAPEQKPSETLGQVVTDGEFTYSDIDIHPERGDPRRVAQSHAPGAGE